MKGVWAAGLGALALVLAAGALGRAPDLSGPMDRPGLWLFDLFQRATPRPASPDPVVAVVDIDEGSIARLGQWPWPRDQVAALVDRLTAAGAAAIAFDVVFSEPDRTAPQALLDRLAAQGARIDLPPGFDPDPDRALAARLGQAPAVLGFALSDETRTALPAPRAGVAVVGDPPMLHDFQGGTANLPVLTDAAPGLGFFSFPVPPDGVIRSLPMVARGQGRLFPSLAAEALRLAQGAGAVVLRTAPGGAPDRLQVGALQAPLGPQGEIWVHHSGLPAMPVLPAAEVLDPGADLSVVEGRIVLVGSSAVGLRDLVATPVDRALPGVRLHAEIIDQIVSGSFLIRPDWAAGAELIAAAALGGAMLGLALWLGAVGASVAALLLPGAALSGAWALAAGGAAGQGLLFDPVLPMLAVLGVAAAVIPLQARAALRDRAFVREAFGRYIAPELVARLAENPDALSLGGETRDLTVLFSDIRGFTALSETLDPAALTGLLNRYLTPMTDVLLGHQATIDKYIGDAIMAFWNAPLTIEEHPARACAAALAMTRAVARLNRDEGRDLAIGIGLHCGPAMVGNMGSDQRFSYSALGDTVNLASRIEGMTKAYGLTIAVTDAVAARAPGFALIEVDRLRVVGRSAPVTLYALLGDAALAGSDEFRRLSAAQAQVLAAYRAADFPAALAALDRLGHLPGAEALATVATLLRDRIAAFAIAPPPPGWDGVHDARSK